MSNAIASQLIGHDLSGLVAMTSQQAFEEPFSGSTIPFGLEEYINSFTILIDWPN